jgi:hypothetical protein
MKLLKILRGLQTIGKLNGQWLLVKLSPYERNFTNKHGVEIGKLQRKAGKEYCDVIDNLAQANKLEN